MSDLARELQAALDDPARYEWGEGPWEHLGDAERDVRLLLSEIASLEASLRRLDRGMQLTLDDDDYVSAWQAAFPSGQPDGVHAALAAAPGGETDG